MTVVTSHRGVSTTRGAGMIRSRLGFSAGADAQAGRRNRRRLDTRGFPSFRVLNRRCGASKTPVRRPTSSRGFCMPGENRESDSTTKRSRAMPQRSAVGMDTRHHTSRSAERQSGQKRAWPDRIRSPVTGIRRNQRESGTGPVRPRTPPPPRATPALPLRAPREDPPTCQQIACTERLTLTRTGEHLPATGTCPARRAPQANHAGTLTPVKTRSRGHHRQPVTGLSRSCSRCTPRRRQRSD